jgi:large subunit ribosomal protein L6
MSRIGKKVIEIPKDVSVVLNLKEEKIKVEGKYGTLEQKVLTEYVEINLIDNQLIFVKKIDTQKAREYHGLIRALVQNMIIGVNQLFSKTLIAEGVGYKFQFEKNILTLNVGFSHPVRFEIPKEINVKKEQKPV